MKSPTYLADNRIEFVTNDVSPSWKVGGKGHTFLCVKSDDPAGISLTAIEYDHEANRERKVVIGLDAEQLKHLLEYLQNNLLKP